MFQYEIKELDKEKYKGYSFVLEYESAMYYDVIQKEMGFELEIKAFDKPFLKQFPDRLFQDWLEEPFAFGIEVEGKLIAFIEGSYETWHDLLRISNINVDLQYRRCGIGHELMITMLEKAKQYPKCRGAILETQSCNYPAIQFYQKHGFKLCRIDICEYSDTDIENKEVRLDFIYSFKRR